LVFHSFTFHSHFICHDTLNVRLQPRSTCLTLKLDPGCGRQQSQVDPYLWISIKCILAANIWGCRGFLADPGTNSCENQTAFRGHAMQTFVKTNMSFKVAVSWRIQEVHRALLRVLKFYF
jgi:hypothetical protein